MDKLKLNDFYKKDFYFSYSSINKLLYSPYLFYKDYILQEREEQVGKHLVDGTLLHCLLLEPFNFDDKFVIIPSKKPSDSIIDILKVIKGMSTEPIDLNSSYGNNVLLTVMKEKNLYQRLKEDESRLKKVLNEDTLSYWEFLKSDKIPIEQVSYDSALERVNIIKSKYIDLDDLLIYISESPFENKVTYVEKPFSINLGGSYNFGLKGVIDLYHVNHDTKAIKCIDVKTTSNVIQDFPKSIEFYNYNRQAAIYITALNKLHPGYTIDFEFLVIDKYNLTHRFEVSEETMSKWLDVLYVDLDKVNLHYTSKIYDTPFDLIAPFKL